MPFLRGIFIFLCLTLAACARATAMPVSQFTAPIQTLAARAQNVTWSRETVTYAQRARDQVLDIWTSQSNGTDKRCLTCAQNFARRNRAGIAPRPQNDFVVFVATNPDTRDTPIPGLAHPSILHNTNLWALKFDGGQTWKLTDLPTDSRTPRAIAQPRFSRDGTRLAWTELLTRDASPQFAWGQWAIVVADFAIENNAPLVKNIRRTQIGDQHAFVALDDWSPDGRALLLSGNLNRGQAVTGSDIFEYTLASDELTQLTDSREIWDANARYSPDGKTIAWISSADLRATRDARDWQNYLQSELWTMERDGANQQRVTFFNQPGANDYAWFQANVAKTNRVIAADHAPSPDGKRSALTLAYPSATGALETIIVLLDAERAQIFSGASSTTIPREQQARYAELAQSLDEFAAPLGAEPRDAQPIIFAADLSVADSARGENLLADSAYQNALAYLDALDAVGARGVQVSIRYPLLAFNAPRAREYVAFYQRLAREIRRRKLILLVNTSVAQADPRASSLEKYKQDKREHLATIVREIQPDYVTVAHEPGWEAKITGLPVTPASFAEHLDFLLGVTDRRNTLLGAGIGIADDSAYQQVFAKNPRVDYYDIRLDAVTRASLERLQQMIQLARAHNKPVIISQAWLAKNSAHDAFAFWQPLDAKFLAATAQFARHNQIAFVAFAQKNYFFASLDYETTPPGLTAQNLGQLANIAARQPMRANQITATGRAFQKLATGK